MWVLRDENSGAFIKPSWTPSWQQSKLFGQGCKSVKWTRQHEKSYEKQDSIHTLPTPQGTEWDSRYMNLPGSAKVRMNFCSLGWSLPSSLAPMSPGWGASGS